jgi:hypothetical protein
MPKRTDISSILVIGAATAMAAAAGPALGQPDEGEYQRNGFASFDSGRWRARAAFFSTDYGYGPQYQCWLSAPGASLVQTRPREAGNMDARWYLLGDEAREHDNLAIDWVRVGGRRFEATMLPWRLVAPTENGIILTYESPLFAVRTDAGAQWLPFDYLTLDMMRAPSFEVGYHFNDRDGSPRNARRVIDLRGFRAAAKWCGRQLLRDRMGEPRVQRLTR